MISPQLCPARLSTAGQFIKLSVSLRRNGASTKSLSVKKSTEDQKANFRAEISNQGTEILSNRDSVTVIHFLYGSRDILNHRDMIFKINM